MYNTYLRTKSAIAGLQRVLLKHYLNNKGWNSQVHWEFPGRFKSKNLSRDNLSTEIGCTRSAGADVRPRHVLAHQVRHSWTSYLSLSLYIYIYIYVYTHIHTYMHTHMSMVHT